MRLKSIVLTPSLIRRLHAGTNHDGPIPAHMPHLGPCAVWTRAQYNFGYGCIGSGSGNGMYYTHRVAWVIAHGPIPDGLFVLHKCDNPPCVMVDHLFLGTHKDNAADRDSKQRNGSITHPEKQVRGDQHPMRLKPECIVRGERLPHSVLTEELVRELRKRFDSGEGVQSLVDATGARYSTIRHAVFRESWKHVK